jgi:hypothetical protein
MVSLRPWHFPELGRDTLVQIVVVGSRRRRVTVVTVITERTQRDFLVRLSNNTRTQDRQQPLSASFHA